jgi:hypothetical protein
MIMSLLTSGVDFRLGPVVLGRREDMNLTPKLLVMSAHS